MGEKMEEDLNVLKEKAIKRGERSKKIATLVTTIFIIFLIIAIRVLPFRLHWWDEYIVYGIKQKSVDEKIESILSSEEHNIVINSVDAKLVSKWHHTPRRAGSQMKFYKKYKVLENNDSFILNNKDLRI